MEIGGLSGKIKEFTGQLVREMVESDHQQAQKDQVITSAGYRVCNGYE
jgi:hypothetical protein